MTLFWHSRCRLFFCFGYVAFDGNQECETGVNVVSLIGNVVTDVDVTDLDRERSVASFVVAVHRPGRDGADYVRVAAWNRQAEACARRLGKGGCVGIHGRLRSRSWQEPDGRRRSALEVVAHQIEFLADSIRSPRVPDPEAAMA